MYIYAVSCTMSNDIAPRWEQFFIEKHLADVVNTGYFTGYSFRQLIDVNNSEEVTFISEYYFDEMSKFEAYNQNAAPALKEEVIELFDGKFKAARQILKTIA